MRAEGDLADGKTSVDGRRATYTVGGSGLPVLFLHGWGLGYSAYRGALRRLTARGCRVLAPSLPGFGGTSELPEGQRSLAGYATWVRDFLDEVGVAEPVFVVGHSFGGGVATRFAHDYPELVRYLVLLNSMGDPGAFKELKRWVRRIDLTPAGMGAAVTHAVLPSRDRLESRRLVTTAFMGNVAANPGALWRATKIIREEADLTQELAALVRRRLPMLVLWGAQDYVIPVTSFDVLCSTIGSEGRVVRGGHSWLLADPEAFGEVLDNVLQIQITERSSGSASQSASEILTLLLDTSMPVGTAARLVDEAAPLWLTSESPTVLAADLALCHPPLRRGEVRAVARSFPEPGMWRLTVVAHDRPRLLADTAAALAAERLSVRSASAVTWERDGVALHALTATSDDAFDDQRWAALGLRLRTMGQAPPRRRFVPAGRAGVTVSPQRAGRALVRVTAPDQLGLLWAICSWFADRDVSIETASVTTLGATASDLFVVQGACDGGALAAALSGRGRSVVARLDRRTAAVLRLLRRVNRPATDPPPRRDTTAMDSASTHPA